MSDELDVLTPVSNRGVRNTLNNSPIACVDWFSATFFSAQNWQELCGILLVDEDLFEVRDSGLHGYRKSAVWDNIQIYFDPAQDNMGIFLNMSGQGCRQFEATFFKNEWSWSDFFGYVKEFECQITRLDLALDDFEGIFTLKQIENKIKTGCVTSLFKTARNFEEHLLTDGQTNGQTIYFGKTDVMIRFYDKFKERVNKGYSMNEEINFWQRTEIQLRKERADVAVRIIADNPENLGEFICGVLKKYIDFKVKGNDTNKARWESTRWWKRFLGKAEKVSLTQVAPEKTILRTKDWIDNQILGSVAMLHEAFGNDDLFTEYLIKLGKTKMSDEQRHLADEFRKDLTKRVEVKEEMRQIVRELDNSVIKVDFSKKNMPAKPREFDRQAD